MSTLPRCRRFVVAALVAVAMAVWPGALGAAQRPAEVACDLTTAERIVAIGDVHGAYDRFVAILQAARLIDGRQRWIGGRAVLVQTGDVLHRGADSRRALDLLRRLEREAPRDGGGRVHALLGNHEVMRMSGDMRYVSEGEYAAFRTARSGEIRDAVHEDVAAEAAARAGAAGESFDAADFRRRFFDAMPLGAIEMRIAFGLDGEYGRWLRARDTMVKINGIVFVHGGISPAVASLGCAAVNETVRAELEDPSSAFDPDALSNSETGPLWYRDLALQPEESFAPALETILERLDARAIVVGHTVTADGRIGVRFGGRVVQIDTGMLGGSFYPEGRASALEIRGGTFTAIYEDSREVLIEDGRARAAPAAAAGAGASR